MEGSDFFIANKLAWKSNLILVKNLKLLGLFHYGKEKIII